MAETRPSTLRSFAGAVLANPTASSAEMGPKPTRFVDFDADDSGAISHVIDEVRRVFPGFSAQIAKTPAQAA